MKVGFSSRVCPEWDLETILFQASALGYEAIELHGLRGQPHLPSCPDLALQPERVTARLAESGLELACLSTSNCFHWPDKATRRQHAAQVIEVLELAVALQCPYVRVPVGQLPPGEQRDRVLMRIVDSLRPLTVEAAARGRTLLLENGGAFSNSSETWFVLDAVMHPSLRCCWDPIAAQAAGEAPGLSVPRLASRIAATHIADAVFARNGSLRGYILPGHGEFDLRRYLTLLRGVGSEAALIFRWPGGRQPGLPGPNEALPAYLAWIKAVQATMEQAPELSAYKGDKNAPRYAGPGSRGPAST